MFIKLVHFLFLVLSTSLAAAFLRCNTITENANFCVTVKDDIAYCYGNSDSCLWGVYDCLEDSDCSKYNEFTSQSFFENSISCNQIANLTDWARDTCNLFDDIFHLNSPIQSVDNVNELRATLRSTVRSSSIVQLMKQRPIVADKHDETLSTMTVTDAPTSQPSTQPSAYPTAHIGLPLSDQLNLCKLTVVDFVNHSCNHRNALPYSNPCHWKGIQCDTTETVLLGIDWDSSSISGSFPSFANFTTLKRLVLSNNLFDGVIAPHAFPPSLEYLDLSNNHLHGSLPSLTYIHNLTHITISTNLLSGSLSSNLLPASVRSLELANNKIHGSIPSFSHMTNLTRLVLSNNNLTGFITIENYPTSLLTMYLNDNNLQGDIPSFQWHQVQLLNLSANNLKGRIFADRLPATLQELSLSSNRLNGKLPTFLHLMNCDVIELDENKFKGTLTTDLFSANLTTLSLSGNLLTGTIPTFAKFRNLENLELAKNILYGSISENLFPASLRNLQIQQNKLTGTVPYLNMTHLFTFNLQQNNFHGQLPTEYCNSYVDEMHLQGNNITCYPSCFTPEVEDFIGSATIPHCRDRQDEMLCDLAKQWEVAEAIKSMVTVGNKIGLDTPHPSLHSRTFKMYTVNVSKVVYYDIYFDSQSYTNCPLLICKDIQCQKVIKSLQGDAINTKWPGVGNVLPIVIQEPYFYVSHSTTCVSAGNWTSEWGFAATIIPYVQDSYGWLCSSRPMTPALDNQVLSSPQYADNYCKWTGVICNSDKSTGVVKELNMKGFGVFGRIPMPHILQSLPTLERLVLSNNGFDEYDLIYLNDGQQHDRLKVLDLSFNQLRGSIDPSILQITSLEQLYIQYNNLNTTFPTFFDTYHTQYQHAINIDARLNEFGGQLSDTVCHYNKRWVNIDLRSNNYACHQGLACNVTLGDQVQYCAPTWMPTAAPYTVPESNLKQQITMGVSVVGTAIFILVVSLLYFRYRKYAAVHGNLLMELKYNMLPLHKAAFEGRELEMDFVVQEESTVSALADDGKTLLDIIVAGRPGYKISLDVFFFIVKVLLSLNETNYVNAKYEESKKEMEGESEIFRLSWNRLVESEDPLVIQVVERILAEHPDMIDTFAYGMNNYGRHFVDVASDTVSRMLTQYINLHKQFALNEEYEYHSKTCEVILAEYDAMTEEEIEKLGVYPILSEDQLFTITNQAAALVSSASSKKLSSSASFNRSAAGEGNKVFVALKFMKHRDQFLNEVETIKALSSSATNSSVKKGKQTPVIQLYHAYDALSIDEDDKMFREDANRKGYGDFPYCVVLEAAKENLQKYLLASNVLGTEWHEIQKIFAHVLGGVQYLHKQGIVHGDLKPTNIVITQLGLYKLIDFDAVATIGSNLGKRVSTAFCPPEMFAQVEDNVVPRLRLTPEAAAVKQPPYDYLEASTSYDMWSCGMLFYYLVCGSLPFRSDQEGNIISDNDRALLMHWTNDVKRHSMLDAIASMNFTTSGIIEKSHQVVLQTRVHNLMSLLLHKSPARRLSIEQTLSHPYFTNQQTQSNRGKDVVYDVFISYRAATDTVHAWTLYQMLTVKYELRVYCEGITPQQPGSEWDKAFCEALIRSSTFVCLLSMDGMFSSTNEKLDFTKLQNHSLIDDCLLEWRLAIELQERGMIECIYPIFVGEPNGNITSSTSFRKELQGNNNLLDMSPSYSNYFTSASKRASAQLPSPARLSREVLVNSVEERVHDILDHYGYGTSYLHHNQQQCTLKGIYDRIVSNQGGFIEGVYEEAVQTISQTIARMIMQSKKEKDQLEDSNEHSMRSDSGF